MLFNSWAFVAFLLVVVSAYYLLRVRYQNMLLLTASYFFYGCWDWRFLGLLVFSTTVDYSVSRAMGAAGGKVGLRRLLLLVSVAVNLGVLAFFKYFRFFFDSAVWVLDSVGLPYSPVTLQMILPVGISFYTFQSLSYTIDVYRGRIAPQRSFFLFALFVAFFPQLVAGPIERAERLIPALRRRRLVDENKLVSGAVLILVGFVKKIAVADFLAGPVSSAFESSYGLSSVRLLLAVYGFALLIYGDFSGYCDIARGTARLLGIDLVANFRQPYFAHHITDFWRRWHISLSTWLRDYLYIPLGGSRRGTVRTHVNLMTTMVLGGLWHGAGWTFVAWGVLHGVYLSSHKLWCRWRPPSRQAPAGVQAAVRSAAGVVVTFHLVCLAWVFFRSPTVRQAVSYLLSIGACRGGIDTEALIDLHRLLMAGGVILLIDLARSMARWREGWFERCHPVWKGVCVGVLCCCLLVFGDRVHEPFIYFQF